MRIRITCQCGNVWTENVKEIVEEDLVECKPLPDGSFDGRDLDILCPHCEHADQMSITRDWERR